MIDARGPDAGERADAPSSGRGERVAGRYRVDALLGRGGMGSVYRVVDESTQRVLALKRLAYHGASDGDWQRLRFRREFHTMARLRHPRIVEVYEYGLDATPAAHGIAGGRPAPLDPVPRRRPRPG